VEESVGSALCQPVAQRGCMNVPFRGGRCGLTLCDVLCCFVRLSASGALTVVLAFPSEMHSSDSALSCLMFYCQPRGHCASVDDHGAGSECSVLIYHSHDSHSLFILLCRSV